MGTAEGPLVFAEHPKHNQLAFDNLALLAAHGSAALLPGHGEPWAFEGAVEKAVAQAVIA
jgi:hypothetical protein